MRKKHKNIFGRQYKTKKEFLNNEFYYLQEILHNLSCEIEVSYNKILFSKDVKIITYNILFYKMPFIEKSLFSMKKIKKEKLL